MKSLLKQIWPILCIAALLMAPACIDDSLRDGSDRNSQTDDDKDNDIDNPGVVRVVTDPETALAAANCIMVKPGQKVSIPITKAFAVWDQYKDLLGKADMTKDMAPMLVWSYPDEMVDWDGLEIEDYDDVNKAVITFKVTPGMRGNALIALTVGGTIRWSWHIWVTDYDPGKELFPEALVIGPNNVTDGKVYRYANGAGDNIFMDRNLGANSADKTSGKQTHGMYYQWGKKDPMPGFATPNFYPEQPWDRPLEYDKNNLAYSIKHPDEYIVRKYYNDKDWYSYDETLHNPDLWGSFSREKTVWDPCPEGWRVPLYGLPRTPNRPDLDGKSFPDYHRAPWRITEPEYQYVWQAEYPGYESPVLGYWPAAGYIDTDGEIWPVPHIYSWSGSDEMPNMFNTSVLFHAWETKTASDFDWWFYHGGSPRVYGANVRCVRFSKVEITTDDNNR